MENRFKRLRHEDDLCLHKIYTMDELADKLQISKATISHLEASEDYDARVSILKQYKKVFPNVSYDYMLGAKNTMENEYSHMEETLPFGDKFYTNLEKLFEFQDTSDCPADIQMEVHKYDEEMHHNITYMLEAMLSNPKRFSMYLIMMYQSLLNIYLIQNPTKRRIGVIAEEDINLEQFKMTQNTINFFTDVVTPQLQNLFEKEREATIKRYDQLENAQKEKTKATLESIGVPENNLPWD